MYETDFRNVTKNAVWTDRWQLPALHDNRL